MAEFKDYSNIKLSETDLRAAIEFYCKAIQRNINSTPDDDIAQIYKRKLQRFQLSLNTINQLELLPQQKQK